MSFYIFMVVIGYFISLIFHLFQQSSEHCFIHLHFHYLAIQRFLYSHHYLDCLLLGHKLIFLSRFYFSKFIQKWRANRLHTKINKKMANWRQLMLRNVRISVQSCAMEKGWTRPRGSIRMIWRIHLIHLWASSAYRRRRELGNSLRNSVHAKWLENQRKKVCILDLITTWSRPHRFSGVSRPRQKSPRNSACQKSK